MAQQFINGITLNQEEVTSYNDSLFWNFFYGKVVNSHETTPHGILPYLDKMNVLVSGLSMTVQAGIGQLYGRHFEVETPTEITVDSGAIGYLVIEVDLNAAELSQVSIRDVTELTQDNLTGSGLVYQMPLCQFDATGGVITINDLRIIYSSNNYGNQLTNSFVTLDTTQTITGAKTFSSTLTTSTINGTGKITTTNTMQANGIMSTASLRSQSGYSQGGVDINTGIKATTAITTDSYIRATGNITTNGRLIINGTPSGVDSNIIYGTVAFNDISESVDFMQFDYSDGDTLFRLNKSGSVSGNSRYLNMQITRGDGSADAGLRIAGATDYGVHHTINGETHKLSYVSTSLNNIILTMSIMKDNLLLDIEQLRIDQENYQNIPVKYNATRSIITNKQLLINRIDASISEFNEELQTAIVRI